MAFENSITGAEAGMQIKYAVKDVEYGKGIFSAEWIPKGRTIWKFCGGINVKEYDGPAAIAHLESLTLSEAQHFLDTTYGIMDKLCLILDDGKYMNHSTSPNCETDMSTGFTYAIRDIEPHEQLFEDYARFEHPDFLLPLLEKYQCAPTYYDIPEEVFEKAKEKSTSEYNEETGQAH